MNTIWIGPKALLALALPLFCLQLSAQDSSRIFKPFKVDISVGGVIPQTFFEGYLGGGILFAIEPKYALRDQWNIGLRFEAALATTAETSDGDIELAGWLGTVDYFFNNNKVRPFIGAGLGLYAYTVPEDQLADPNTYEGENLFGGIIRGGFEMGHFRLGIEYNMVSESQYSKKNDYLGLKAGVCLGGGRKVK
jgi:outer membrane protein X